MKKTGIAGFLLIGMCGAAGAQSVAGGDCVHIAKTVSDMQLAMAGMGDLVEIRKELAQLRDRTPAMEEELNGLVEVARQAESSELGTPSHPLSTGAYDDAEAAYKEKYGEECGPLQ